RGTPGGLRTGGGREALGGLGERLGIGERRLRPGRLTGPRVLAGLVPRLALAHVGPAHTALPLIGHAPHVTRRSALGFRRVITLWTHLPIASVIHCRSAATGRDQRVPGPRAVRQSLPGQQ